MDEVYDNGYGMPQAAYPMPNNDWQAQQREQDLRYLRQNVVTNLMTGRTPNEIDDVIVAAQKIVNFCMVGKAV